MPSVWAQLNDKQKKALAKLPLVVDGRFNIYRLTATVITRACTEKQGHGNQQKRNAHQPDQCKHTTPAGSVVNPVKHGTLGIGDPTHSSRGLQAQVVPDDAFHRRAGSDAFGDGWNAEAEFHGVDLIAFQNTKVKLSIYYLPFAF